MRLWHCHERLIALLLAAFDADNASGTRRDRAATKEKQDYPSTFAPRKNTQAVVLDFDVLVDCYCAGRALSLDRHEMDTLVRIIHDRLERVHHHSHVPVKVRVGFFKFLDLLGSVLADLLARLRLIAAVVEIVPAM